MSTTPSVRGHDRMVIGFKTTCTTDTFSFVVWEKVLCFCSVCRNVMSARISS
jgi:hypothetical protein